MAKDNRRLELTQVPCRQGCWNLEAGVKVYPKVSPGILLLELELDAYSLHLMFMLLYFFSIFFYFSPHSLLSSYLRWYRQPLPYIMIHITTQ